jgi:hypothetical protein
VRGAGLGQRERICACTWKASFEGLDWWLVKYGFPDEVDFSEWFLVAIGLLGMISGTHDSRKRSRGIRFNK